MGGLGKGVPGEVFSAWFVEAAKWGLPAAGLATFLVATILGVTEGDIGPSDTGSLFLLAFLLGAFLAPPYMAVGGVAAGLTAVIVTRLWFGSTRSTAYSRGVRIITAGVTAATVGVTAYATLFNLGTTSFADQATLQDWLVWFGPPVLVTIGAVWIAGRTAVTRSLRFLAPEAAL